MESSVSLEHFGESDLYYLMRKFRMTGEEYLFFLMKNEGNEDISVTLVTRIMEQRLIIRPGEETNAVMKVRPKASLPLTVTFTVTQGGVSKGSKRLHPSSI